MNFKKELIIALIISILFLSISCVSANDDLENSKYLESISSNSIDDDLVSYIEDSDDFDDWDDDFDDWDDDFDDWDDDFDDWDDDFDDWDDGSDDWDDDFDYEFEEWDPDYLAFSDMAGNVDPNYGYLSYVTNAKRFYASGVSCSGDVPKSSVFKFLSKKSYRTYESTNCLSSSVKSINFNKFNIFKYCKSSSKHAISKQFNSKESSYKQLDDNVFKSVKSDKFVNSSINGLKENVVIKSSFSKLSSKNSLSLIFNSTFFNGFVKLFPIFNLVKILVTISL